MKLELPNSYVEISYSEMMYLEAGKTTVYTGSAKYLKGLALTDMLAWCAVGGGYGATGTFFAATGGGIPLAVLAGFGSAYCLKIADDYRNAYNYFSKLVANNDWRTRKFYVYTVFGINTGVGYE